MDLSIIIPSYNTKDLLRTCLQSIDACLKQSEISYEIIVIDNGSTDGTKEMLEKNYKRVIKVFNKENIGFGASNNTGVKIAKGEYILLLNSDTEIVGDALTTLFRYTKSHPKSFVGAKLFNTDGSAQPSAGPEYNLWIVFLMLFCKGDMLGVSRYSPDTDRRVDWVSGACMMANKLDFLAVGGFDEDIFMYMDEMDLLYRARMIGYQVYFSSASHLIHVGAASSGSRKDPVGQIFRGLAYYYRKHYNKRSQMLLGGMLQVKAALAIGIGKVTGNTQLVSIYENALQLAS